MVEPLATLIVKLNTYKGVPDKLTRHSFDFTDLDINLLIDAVRVYSEVLDKAFKKFDKEILDGKPGSES